MKRPREGVITNQISSSEAKFTSAVLFCKVFSDCCLYLSRASDEPQNHAEVSWFVDQFFWVEIEERKALQQQLWSSERARQNERDENGTEGREMKLLFLVKNNFFFFFPFFQNFEKIIILVFYDFIFKEKINFKLLYQFSP